MTSLRGLGDEARFFGDLYQEHYGPIFGYLLRRLRDRDQAADACADVFLVVWRRLEDVPKQPRAWLFTVARNVLMASYRARPPVGVALDEHPLASTDPGPAERAEDADALRRVALAVRQLSPSDQEILLLAAWEQLTPLEMSEVLGCSRTAATVRLHRARRRLKSSLEHGPTSSLTRQPPRLTTVPGEAP